MILNKISCTFLLVGIFICIVSAIQMPLKNHKQENQSCKKHCPLRQRWICSFNGTHYRFFINKCWMEKYNCAEKEEYNHVERKLCQKAHQEYQKSIIATHHNKLNLPKSNNKCLKCTAGYKPVCGYNGDINHMFKNSCHLKRFNCIHNDKKYQTTALNNCPIPIINKIGESKNEDDIEPKNSRLGNKKN